MSTAIPTGGGGPGPPLTSYADKAKMNIRFDQRLKRNVLDIEVEKTDVREEMFLDQNVVAKLLNNLGMDINLGSLSWEEGKIEDFLVSPKVFFLYLCILFSFW